MNGSRPGASRPARTSFPTSQRGGDREMQMLANTIFITGGTSGIGRGLAEAFHKQGNRIIISAILRWWRPTRRPQEAHRQRQQHSAFEPG